MIIVLWAVCAIVNYGLSYAYWTSKYKGLGVDVHRESWPISLFMAIIGPCGSITILCRGISGGYQYKGFKFKREKNNEDT